MPEQIDASIIVPVYNAERCIVQCISSLLSQDFRGKYETIVVDDGSTDGTIELLKQFGKKTRFVRQKHRGPAAARNNGAKNAKGKFLVFIDSDCMAERDWLKEMLKPFKDKRIAGVQGRYRTKQKGLMARFNQIEIEDRYNRMRRKKPIDHVGSYSAAYRKDVFLAFKGFDESFPVASGEDPELSYRISSKGHKLVFTETAIIYHSHPESLFKYLKTKFYRAYWRVRLYKKHTEKMVRDSYTPQVLKLQIALLYGCAAAGLLSAFNSVFFAVAAALFLLLILSAVPFSLFAFSLDPAVGLISPLLILLRTLAFCLGLLWGAIRGLTIGMA